MIEDHEYVKRLVDTNLMKTISYSLPYGACRTKDVFAIIQLCKLTAVLTISENELQVRFVKNNA